MEEVDEPILMCCHAGVSQKSADQSKAWPTTSNREPVSRRLARSTNLNQRQVNNAGFNVNIPPRYPPTSRTDDNSK
jgi:hypothetical protein